MPSIPPPTSPLANAGSVIAGKYRLDSIVGYGGMGSVWAATHLGLGHQIAIKLISQAHIRSTEVRRRFDTEAKAVARLKSRHVVQVYDNGELEDGTPFIAMELLHGESLHRRIHRAGPMQLAEVVQVIGQICRALTKAHASGIIHRDIKPDNIFLAQSEDDGGYIAKVLDFGVAKLAVTDGEQSSTQTGSLVGTPLYMSPEQARGLKQIDHRTDLFSLALVTYTMLSGNLAFSGESFGDLLLKICTQPLPSLREHASWLPATIDDWFQRAAAREPQDRFQSAQEFADALAAAAGTAPMRGATGSIADRTGNIPIMPPQGALGDSVTKQYERGKGPAASASTMTGATVAASQPPDGAVPRKKVGVVIGISAGLGTLVAMAIGAFVIFGHRDAPPPSAAAGGANVNVTAVVPAAPPPPEAPKVDPAPTSEPAPPATAAATTTPKTPPHVQTQTGKAAGQAPAPPPPKQKQNSAANKPAKTNSDTVDLGY